MLALLQRKGARYTWNPVDTPELNSTSERKFRTLGEQCLSMLLLMRLLVDCWWDAYKTPNYLTLRLPTKTAHGYITHPSRRCSAKCPRLIALENLGLQNLLEDAKGLSP